MHDFLKFYGSIEHGRGWALQIYHSSIVDWSINLGYKLTHPKHGEQVFHIQHCDMDLAFAMAQVALKEWLSENEGGY